MYERRLGRNLGRIKVYAGVSLCIDLFGAWFGCSPGDCFLLILSCIYPVVDGDSPFCVLFDLISQFQAWHLALPKYVMQGRGANIEFLCYAALFLIIALHPFCKSVQAILFLYFFFWTKIRYSDTIAIISRRGLKNNFFDKIEGHMLTYIDKCVTMMDLVTQKGDKHGL